MTRAGRCRVSKGATPIEFQSDIAALRLPEGPGLVVYLPGRLRTMYLPIDPDFGFRTDARTIVRPVPVHPSPTLRNR